jgi:ABC-type phosphate/phosphonate transport system permease subunit
MAAFDPEKKEEGSFTSKFKQSIDTLKKNEKVEEIYQFAQTNTRDTVAYVILATGLLLSLFNASWLGYTLVGIVFGLYYGREMYAFAASYREFLKEKGHVKSLILAGTLLGIFIAAPFLFVGALVAVAFRQFLVSEK